jgi:sugar phosphate permease
VRKELHPRVLTIAFAIGYFVFYLCRVGLSVVRPVWLTELIATGASEPDALRMVGNIVSIGMLAAAVCKLTVGRWIDRERPTKPYVIGGLLVALTTVVVATGWYASWLLGSVAHRAAQTLGWPSLSKWVASTESVANRNRVLGYCSMSWILGDALARFSHGALINAGVPWRWSFFAAAFLVVACMGGILMIAPRISASVDFVDDTDHIELGSDAADCSLSMQRAFWGALGLSIALSLSREALLEWMPTYLVSIGLLRPGGASILSAVVPLGAAAGTLYLGKVYYRVPGKTRPKAFTFFLVIAAVGLMSIPLASSSLTIMLLCLIAIGITLGGAYATLLGEVAASLGGRRNVASTTSIIDGVGSIAGILAGRGIAELVAVFGWGVVWFGLGSICVFALAGWIVTDKSTPLCGEKSGNT